MIKMSFLKRGRGCYEKREKGHLSEGNRVINEKWTRVKIKKGTYQRWNKHVLEGEGELLKKENVTFQT